MLKALILAGSGKSDKLKEDEETPKALIKINGREMILYILEALKKLDYIEKIVVVGPEKKLRSVLENYEVEVVQQGYELIDNVMKGLECFSDEDEVLILTSDIPMITPEALDDFVKRAKESDAEFAYPIISKEDTERKFPGVKRTYVKVKEGTFTGGNVVLVRVGSGKKCLNKARDFFIYRKSPWKLAAILGIPVVLKFLLGRITISEIEKRVFELFGINARAVISRFPELGSDVDKESDLELARRVLAREVLP
jgi:GTP:adenosylcobinamide-phosphate guanylyltransferase